MYTKIVTSLSRHEITNANAFVRTHSNVHGFSRISKYKLVGIHNHKIS